MIVAVNLEKLEKSFGSNVKVFNYSVEAKTAFFDQMVKGNNQWSKLTNSDIQLKQLPYKEAVALWIIISCSFTGLLFLLLIIIALIKVIKDTIRMMFNDQQLTNHILIFRLDFSKGKSENRSKSLNNDTVWP